MSRYVWTLLILLSILIYLEQSPERVIMLPKAILFPLECCLVCGSTRLKLRPFLKALASQIADAVIEPTSSIS